MNKREVLTEDERKFLRIVHELTPDRRAELIKVMQLLRVPAFCTALDAATPPGESLPSLEVVRALVKQFGKGAQL